MLSYRDQRAWSTSTSTSPRFFSLDRLRKKGRYFHWLRSNHGLGRRSHDFCNYKWPRWTKITNRTKEKEKERERQYQQQQKIQYKNKSSTSREAEFDIPRQFFHWIRQVISIQDIRLTKIWTWFKMCFLTRSNITSFSRLKAKQFIWS